MAHLDRTVLQPNPRLRASILTVLEAALAAVDPAAAVAAVATRTDDQLIVAGRTYDLARYKRVLVVGAGKAGAPMTQAIESILGDKLTAGLVVVKEGHAGPTRCVELVEASHPMPNQAGAEAGRRIVALADQATDADLIIALLSGGGSALLVAPADGLTLADLQAMTDLLLASGATIQEINCLRKHCSAVKGGQLARSAQPATLITLALSDVIGSPLDVIASGPTVADNSTWSDAMEIVERYALADRLPAPIIARLAAGQAGELADTPKADDPAFSRSQTVVVADNRVAAVAAVDCAETLGFHPLLLTTYLQGEAREVAKVVVGLGKEIVETNRPVARPACLVLGGETTVTLGANPGRGGRNQELALAAALQLVDSPAITVVSLATDGTDGPTDSAGGIADSGTVARGAALGKQAEAFLNRHDAYDYLAATDDLLLSGPTQTNVNDLVFVFVE